jgi:hypothetical protein
MACWVESLCMLLLVLGATAPEEYMNNIARYSYTHTITHIIFNLRHPRPPVNVYMPCRPCEGWVRGEGGGGWGP